MKMWGALAIIVPFAAIAGLMASLITYNELQHHLDPQRARVEAAKTGVLAGLVVAALALVAAITISMFMP